MKFSNNIRPISYVKTHASEIVSNLSETMDTIVITQNGEAKAVLQDIHSYEQAQDTLAMLKIIAQSRKDLDQGKIKPLNEAFSDIKGKNSSITEQ